ncbi:MAG: TPM domain-containing protein [Clostridiaceae bacterium]|nr:TPM domain-containing protein [Clostridiaceae bacterium]
MKKGFNLLLIILLLVSFIPLSVYGEEITAYERQLPRLVDAAGLLTQEQAERLTQKLDEVSERQNLDVIIITVDSLEGYTATEFADDTFDYSGFGMGDNYDGILLLLSMEERDWAISTHGYGITVFTDAGQKYMVENFIGYISNGDYYEGFVKFADLADSFITQAKAGAPYDINNLPKKPMSPIWILISILGGVLIALIITGVMRSSLKSVSKQRVASNYIVSTVMTPFANKDLYLYSVVKRTAKPKESSGGSSTHRSSSGRTHGGSSGKF